MLPHYLIKNILEEYLNSISLHTDFKRIISEKLSLICKEWNSKILPLINCKKKMQLSSVDQLKSPKLDLLVRYGIDVPVTLLCRKQVLDFKEITNEHSLCLHMIREILCLNNRDQAFKGELNYENSFSHWLALKNLITLSIHSIKIDFHCINGNQQIENLFLSLESLKLHSNSNGSEFNGIDELFVILSKSVKLRNLSLINKSHPFGHKCLHLIPMFKSIYSLTLSAYELSSETLIKIITHSSALKQLICSDLSFIDNSIEIAYQKIFQTLSTDKKLSTIYFRISSLGIEVDEYIVNFFNQNNSCKDFGFYNGSNPAPKHSQDIKSITDSKNYKIINNSIEKLVISTMDSVTIENYIHWWQYNCSIKTLVLENLHSLIEHIFEMKSLQDIQLLNFNNLESLDNIVTLITYNMKSLKNLRFSSLYGLEIYESLKLNDHIKVLHMKYTVIEMWNPIILETLQKLNHLQIIFTQISNSAKIFPLLVQLLEQNQNLSAIEVVGLVYFSNPTTYQLIELNNIFKRKYTQFQTLKIGCDCNNFKNLLQSYGIQF
ncbi:hypothetical protein DLAC_10469 [Tieghemostelium lacteum]|uniref:Uncharacterized protein n=1 Tax=Tieghemostelium lacteum TaxID=361077 RepID=A0A151Z5H1_TIELA|nr:hypothetical protein DLAC_10469 [Tieghemostelium lacteum]|eukprot:KYQ89219.1 hypothetical protein DLAC_10469 [Tieghemostelium lacteum]